MTEATWTRKESPIRVKPPCRTSAFRLSRSTKPVLRPLAKHIGNITTLLEEAVAQGDLGAINNAVAELGRLGLALEAWDELIEGPATAQSLTAQEFLDELRKFQETPVRPVTDDPSETLTRRRLFRRLAGFEEIWVFPQVVVASNQEEAEGDIDPAFQGEGDCARTEFDGAEQVEEISPDDLEGKEYGAKELQEVAHFLAHGVEHEQIKGMSEREIREWIGRKLEGQ